MRKLVLIAAAAGCLLALPASAPEAYAQSSITVGPGGVTVRDRDRHRPRHESRHWRHRDRADCRTTTVRHRRADGTVVVRKSRTC